MVGTFNTAFILVLKIKLLDLNHIKKNYAKCHLTNTLLNFNLILGRDILHELGKNFNFKNKTITWQEVSISIKPPNCTANEFFVIKESKLVQNTEG